MSEEISSLPATPAAQPPESPPEPVQQPVDTGQTATPAPAEPTQAATPAAPAPRQAIDDFAASVDMPATYFSQFETVDQAKTAYRQHVDFVARQGMAMVQPAVPPVQQPASPAVPAQPTNGAAPFDLKAIGIDDPDEPAAKVAAYFQQQLAERDAKIAQFDQHFKASEAQAKAQLQAQADEIVDGFASPSFGTLRAQTLMQQMQRETLYQLANNIYNGYINAQQPPPSLKARLAMAKDMYDRHYGAMPSVTTAQQPATPTPSAAALSTRSPAGSGGQAPGGSPYVGRLANDPELRAKLGM